MAIVAFNIKYWKRFVLYTLIAIQPRTPFYTSTLFCIDSTQIGFIQFKILYKYHNIINNIRGGGDIILLLFLATYELKFQWWDYFKSDNYSLLPNNQKILIFIKFYSKYEKLYNHNSKHFHKVTKYHPFHLQNKLNIPNYSQFLTNPPYQVHISFLFN